MIPDIGNAKDLSFKTPYFPDGFQGRCVIDEMRELSGFAGHALVITLTPETSNLPDVAVGAQHSWYVSFATPKQIEWNAPVVKQFMMAAVGAKTEEARNKVAPSITALTNAAVQPNQPMKGTKINLRTQKNQSGSFTKHFFSPV